jgi:peptidoglycan/LPS O-acetylase OafA/YrhL
LNPVNPLPALAAITLAIFVAASLARRFPLPLRQGRFDSIDGLRGYLAFFVFVHHGCVWYYYLQTRQWQLPPSNLYVYFGQGSVAAFFMITGFLFGSKLLQGRQKAIDWTALYVSRLLRLWPLYLVAIVTLLLIVAIVTRGDRVESWPMLLEGLAAWLGFTIFGAPDLNGLANTALIVAGVTWTLCYECLFYFSLPVLALVVGAAVPWRFVAFGLAGTTLIALALWPIEPLFVMPFLTGALSAPIAGNAGCRQFARKPFAAWIVIACAVSSVLIFPYAYAIAPLLILSIAFALIACGCDLFGLLLLPASRMLGALSYSIYLLHGIILFVVFGVLIGTDQARSWSVLNYWLAVVALTPILVCAGFVTHRLIEHPAIRLAKRWANSKSTPAYTISVPMSSKASPRGQAEREGKAEN